MSPESQLTAYAVQELTVADASGADSEEPTTTVSIIAEDARTAARAQLVIWRNLTNLSDQTPFLIPRYDPWNKFRTKLPFFLTPADKLLPGTLSA